MSTNTGQVIRSARALENVSIRRGGLRQRHHDLWRGALDYGDGIAHVEDAYACGCDVTSQLRSLARGHRRVWRILRRSLRAVA